MEFSEFLPVWDRLTEDQRELLESRLISRTMKKGERISAGAPNCMGLLLIRSGQLRASILSEEGREITIYRLFDRDLCLFSAACMLRSIQFEITISAEKDTALWVIPADVYQKVMEESAALANFTNEVMGTRFSEVMWLMEQILWKSFDKRLAGFLLEEMAIEGTKQLKITHEAIGNHLGNPREVVTRMLRYFQNEGLVLLSRGTVEILEEKQLRRIAR